MKIALVGNQNSGKTTLFNLLTGLNQKIGNWPGVTIERKEGVIKGTSHVLVDLPGVYSMSPYTVEEEVSRQFAFEERPDIIINIIDATSVERSLYLTTQLMELDGKVIVALNMCDMLEEKGIHIDEKKLEEAFGIKFIKISALKKTGIDELIKSLTLVGQDAEKKKLFPDDVEEYITAAERAIQGKTPHKRFAAVKMLEGDKLFSALQTDELKSAAVKLTEKYGMDAEQIVANERYNFIVAAKSAAVTAGQRKESITDKLDKIFLNKYAALPIFAAIMFLIYFLSVGLVGRYTVDAIDSLVLKFGGWLSVALRGVGASEWAVSLVVDGIVAGVGAVLTFVPQLIVLFLLISILETSGYMSRIAFFLDRLFKKIGLSGKSLIPFIVGVGCSVPGIMTARTVENESERKMTVILTPFIPCSAKLPIIALFAGYFFKNYSGLISASLYFFAVGVIIVTALIMKKFAFKGGGSSFISELPAYKFPSPRYVLRDVVEKTASFIRRAGTVILLCSVIIWLLASFSWDYRYGVDIGESMLAGIGNALGWLFYPMLGEWSWAASVSAIQGLIAKEQVVSSMEIIAGLAEGAGGEVFRSSVFSFFTGASAYAYMVFCIFSAPCIASIAAMRRELGSTKKMLAAVAFQTVFAWLLSCLVFGIGRFFEVVT
ncbi:MAG: ferrous iron transport protein B [Christensenellales bacterium]|jgi:ferrous iron transport protein B